MTSSLLFSIATLSYLVAMVLYISYLAFRKKGIGTTATIVTVFGFLVQTAALLLRWRESYQMDIGRVPLSNLYESLVFFTWSTVMIYLIVEFKYKTKAFGAFVIPVAFLALAFINVAGISSDITPLVPALKSNWLFYHVLISFLGYAAFGVAFAISMVYLLIDMEERGSATNLYAGLAAIVVLASIGYFMASLGGRMKTAFWMGIGVLYGESGWPDENCVLDGNRRADSGMVHLSYRRRGAEQTPGFSLLVILRYACRLASGCHGNRFYLSCFVPASGGGRIVQETHIRRDFFECLPCDIHYQLAGGSGVLFPCMVQGTGSQKPAKTLHPGAKSAR